MGWLTYPHSAQQAAVEVECNFPEMEPSPTSQRSFCNAVEQLQLPSATVDAERSSKEKNMFCYGKMCVRGIKLDQKVTPDLLESIMRPPGLAPESLRLILFKTNQFRPEVTKVRVVTFGCPEDSRIPARGQHSKQA